MTQDITDPGKHPVEPISGGSSNSPAEQTPDSEGFKTQMEKTPDPIKTSAPSPMDIASTNKIPSTPPTLDTVQNQAHAVSSSLGDIKNQLHKKGLKLKNHEKTLISKKLKQAGEHMHTAAKNVGADTKPFDKNLYNSRNPISKFLAMVSDGQHQMVSAADNIKSLNSSGKSVEPGKLLLVQIKLNKAQQLLTYTSTILGNATGMIKTMMNIQI